MKLSNHQKRVLAALLELESQHAWDWWSRYAIGDVVGAGGFHGTIQIKTMSILKGRGWVQTERSSWPEGVRDRVRCGCACGKWGLTSRGREIAASLNVKWDERSKERAKRSGHEAIANGLDEDDANKRFRERLDDNG